MGYKIITIWRLFRVQQWVKNFLIFFPLVFAGNIRNIFLGQRAFIVFVLFSLLASAVYIINDIIDVKLDRLHEKKKMRPIASGAISVSVALAVHFLLIIISLWGTFYFIGRETAGFFLLYYAVNLAYSTALKKHPPLDIIIVALFYLIRPIIGAVAIGVPVSNWLILTTFFAALYLVSLKRLAELSVARERGIITRKNLDLYSTEALKIIGIISLAVTIMSYGLYASTFSRLFITTIIPLTALGLRFVLLLERDKAIFESPETLIFKDKIAFTLFGIWLLMVVYYHW